MGVLADLPDLAARVSAALVASGIRHAISGSLAMAAHGFVRATRDVDLLVAAPALRLIEVFEIVRGFGFEGEDAELVSSLRERGVAELRRGPASVEILAPILPYHHAVLDRAVELSVGGGRVPFVTAEDLVVLKLLWLRDKDRADLRALLAARGSDLDLAYVRSTLDGLLPPGDERLQTLEALLAGK